MDRQPPVLKAIEKAGGTVALAKALGCAPAAVSQWKQVPLSRVPAVSKITGIPRHELRKEFAECECGLTA